MSDASHAYVTAAPDLPGPVPLHARHALFDVRPAYLEAAYAEFERK
jgi:hypothetical protein